MKSRAILAILVAGVVVAGCTSITGTGHYTDTATATTLVKSDALAPLLPSADEIAEVTAIPKLVSLGEFQVLQSKDVDTFSDPKCIGAMYALLEPTYRGSGHHSTVGFFGDDPGSPYAPDVMVGASTFEDASSAAGFVDEQTAAWGDCADRPVSEAGLKPGELGFTWVAAPPVTVNGVRTVTRTLEALRGFGCTRAMGARSNVVADADVCAAVAADSAPRAADLVMTILDAVGG